MNKKQKKGGHTLYTLPLAHILYLGLILCSWHYTGHIGGCGVEYDVAVCDTHVTV